MDADRTLLGNLILSRAAVDRAAELRTDEVVLAEVRREPQSRVLRVCDSGARVEVDDAGTRLAFTSAADVEGELSLLGVEDGVAYFAEHVPERDNGTWGELRRIGADLSARDAGLLVTAVALDNWLRTHERCPRCGTTTEFSAGGWARRCPQDGSEHFPRTDPAVIVLVRDRDDRALLGRQGVWEDGWFSTLAGFVEAGESAEAAVRREVQEESGIVIGSGPDDIWYLGSQPWPFPRSLMLGYHAWTDRPDDVLPDGEEIVEVRWFTRDELAAACASGEVRLPPQVSIARRLVERWYGAELPGDWSRPLTPAR